MTDNARAQLDRPLLDASGLDLDSAQQVTYDYDGPAYNLDHKLVVIPRARHGSLRRRLHTVSVSAPEARVRSGRDGHGNLVVRVGVDVVDASVSFTVAAVVERKGAPADAVLPASALTDPRWLRPTRLTAADDAIRSLAVAARAADPLDFAAGLCQQVRVAMPYEYGVTSHVTTAAEALALGRGVCQDHAHVALAACRAAGVPSRYVSGHLLGDSGTHAWIEVAVGDGDGARAVAFDPCNGCRAGARHLPVATGRDYADVAPTSGSYDGEARGWLTADKQLGVTLAA